MTTRFVFLAVVVVGLLFAALEVLAARWEYAENVRRKMPGLRLFAAAHFVRASWLMVVGQACLVGLSVVAILYAGDMMPSELAWQWSGLLYGTAVMCSTAHNVMNRYDRRMIIDVADAEEREALLLAPRAAKKQEPDK